ncbi:hypothetical protein VTO42DRAFT_664 [Malbranchea cinnamomea]
MMMTRKGHVSIRCESYNCYENAVPKSEIRVGTDLLWDMSVCPQISRGPGRKERTSKRRGVVSTGVVRTLTTAEHRVQTRCLCGWPLHNDTQHVIIRYFDKRSKHRWHISVAA